MATRRSLSASLFFSTLNLGVCLAIFASRYILYYAMDPEKNAEDQSCLANSVYLETGRSAFNIMYLLARYCYLSRRDRDNALFEGVFILNTVLNAANLMGLIWMLVTSPLKMLDTVPLTFYRLITPPILFFGSTMELIAKGRSLNKLLKPNLQPLLPVDEDEISETGSNRSSLVEIPETGSNRLSLAREGVLPS